MNKVNNYINDVITCFMFYIDRMSNMSTQVCTWVISRSDEMKVSSPALILKQLHCFSYHCRTHSYLLYNDGSQFDCAQFYSEAVANSVGKWYRMHTDVQVTNNCRTYFRGLQMAEEIIFRLSHRQKWKGVELTTLNWQTRCFKRTFYHVTLTIIISLRI